MSFWVSALISGPTDSVTPDFGIQQLWIAVNETTRHGIGLIGMWWTAITFAAVAAWFEWQYRRDRKGPPSGDVDVSTEDQPQEIEEPEKPEASAVVDHLKPVAAAKPLVQALEAAPPSNTPRTAGRNR